jgi:hypothetical protein
MKLRGVVLWTGIAVAAALLILSGADEAQVARDRLQRRRNLGKAFYENPTGAVRLWLSLIAYNLGNLWRGCPLGPALPRKIGNWSLTSLQQRLVKTGGRLIKHARYYWLLLAESHLTRRLFGAMVRRIAALPVATG